MGKYCQMALRKDRRQRQNGHNGIKKIENWIWKMTEIKEYISTLLQKFDLVLLVMNGSGIAENLTENFLDSEALRNAEKTVLVLSDRNISNQNISYKNISDTNTRHQYCRLDTAELEAVRSIYFLYDFSDHFRILSDNRQYGGLLDYVKTGIMTMEDVFQTILGF